MSRPPTNAQHLSSSYDNRNGLIDFVNVPVSQLNQSYSLDDMHPSIYAQAGFPGYAGPAMGAAMGPVMGPTMMPMMMPATGPSMGAAMYPSSQALLPAPLGAGMQLYQTQGYPQPIAAPAYLPAPEVTPIESEAVLHERINRKIDDIINAQKDNVLNSKIESISNKVEQLHHNLAQNQASAGSDTAHIHRLSEKVQQLSQSLERAHEKRLQAQMHFPAMTPAPLMQAAYTTPYTVSDKPISTTPLHISADPSDTEISRRLRKLSAESSVRARSERIPDW